MNPRLKASRAAIELIKRFEGYRRASAQLADGRWTIGYGHTKTARQGVEVSQDDAESLLLYDLIDVQAAINDWVFTPVNQNQFDALAAFAFNIGVENFRRSSALRRVNEGNMVQAACAIEMWRKADLDGERIVVDALVRRRAAEKALFLTPVDGWVAAPSPIVRPRVDYDVGVSLPRMSAEVSVSLEGERGVAHRAAVGGDAPATVAAATAITERLKALNLAEADAGIDLGPAAPPADPAGRAEAEPFAAPQAAPEPAPPAPVESEPFETEAPAGEFALTAPPESLPAPEPREDPAFRAPNAPDGAALFDRPIDIPYVADADASRRIARREAPMEIEDDPFADDAPKVGGVPLLVVGLMGLAVFAGAVFWGVNAKGSGGLLDPLAVASVLGVAGIVLVCVSVYLLLLKIGGKGD